MRILAPIIINNSRKLSHICGEFFTAQHGFKILDYDFNNLSSGNIDFFATKGERAYLACINTSDFKETLFRSFLGYKWYLENQRLLSKIYFQKKDDFKDGSSPIAVGQHEIGNEIDEHISSYKPPCLIILSHDFLPGIYFMLNSICKIPIQLYKYLIFGSVNEPEIFIEKVDQYQIDPHPQASPIKEDPKEQDFNRLRKELGIELANCSDNEIKNFLSIMESNNI